MIKNRKEQRKTHANYGIWKFRYRMQFREEIWAFNRNFSQTPSIDTPLVKWNQQNSVENFENFTLFSLFFFLGTRPKQATIIHYPQFSSNLALV